MKIKQKRSRKIFILFNAVFLTLVTFTCILPFVHLLAVSLSSNIAATSGEVKLLPVDFTLASYNFLYDKPEFLAALLVSLKRVAIGTVINMTMVILTAYPLSKNVDKFRMRTVYVWFFAFTMFFGGGLIPTYIVVKNTGLLDTIWALVLPGALSVWNTVMLLNFFRGVPRELEEAAVVDGAGHLRILKDVFLPVSLPSLATILLFTMIGHWNSWFDGMLYMNSPDHYPLQTYLSTLVIQVNKSFISVEDLSVLKNISDKTVRSAQIFLGALPIMMVYPFLQKYFIKGIVVGSVKG